MPDLLPITIVVATRDRANCVRKFLESLAIQSAHVAEVVFIDGSEDLLTRSLVERRAFEVPWRTKFLWDKAVEVGAASQRNQGVNASSQPFILFCDDDVTLKPSCLMTLFRALKNDKRLGGASAMIINQKYTPPGFVSRTVFTLLHGQRLQSFAGKVIRPCIHLLPEDRNVLPEVVDVDWLNLGCTIYRREALPDPAFDSFFAGYSMMEDLALSLRVRQRGWKLANVRTSQIFHNSQSSLKKSNVREFAAMELNNRHYVMRYILNRNAASDYLRLATWEMFSLVTGAARRGPKYLACALQGKWRGVKEIWRDLRNA